LVAVDGSEHGAKAIDLARRVWRQVGPRPCRVRGGEAEFLRAAGNELLQRAEDRAKGAGATHVTAIFDTGDPATRIVHQAEAYAADLIVMGGRGLGDLGGLLLGSVSHKVAQMAPCVCMTVK
jgi:nucleotide-binding universal stress UspA family protein